MNKKIVVVSVLLGTCLAVGVYALTLARTKKAQSRIDGRTPFTQQITSCAKGVRVVKAEIVNGGTPNATVEIQIENLSYLGITAVALEATTGSESYMTTLRSSFKDDKPLVVIKPYDTGILNVPVSFSDSLRIGSVFYEDGTEEGCASSLKTLHEVKQSEKSKKESSHEKNPPSPDPSHR